MKHYKAKQIFTNNSIRTPGHLQSCTLGMLLYCSYHSLGSRLWASRHRRELWGWISCTIQIKPHRRRKQYRWTYRTATWEEERRDTEERIEMWQMYRAIHTRLTADVLPYLFFPWVMQSCREHWCIQTQSWHIWRLPAAPGIGAGRAKERLRLTAIFINHFHCTVCIYSTWSGYHAAVQGSALEPSPPFCLKQWAEDSKSMLNILSLNQTGVWFAGIKKKTFIF